MLTAVENFFEKKLGKSEDKGLKTEIQPVQNKKKQKKEINKTMASFFAPLPIIGSVQPTCDDENKDLEIMNHQNVNDLEIITDQQHNNPSNALTRPLQSNKKGDVWFVARYGRIYKRKAHSKVGYAHIPCPPGHRYCKECQKPMPLDKFYTNVKRYICRHHHYLRVNKRFRERVLTSDYEKMAEMAWLDLFRLCPILGYPKAEYDRHDIKDLVINTKIPLSVIPRAMPIDPSIPLRPRNVAIVTSANMSLLVKVYTMTCSRAQYILLVQSFNLLPPNADAGVPWAPFHNPDYVRQDIDVVPILEKEKLMPKELPHVEAVREMMKEDESKINECKDRLGRSENFNNSGNFLDVDKKEEEEEPSAER